jgi:uncharacterized protein DUF6847
MKLGEALTLRARQAQRLNDLHGRIKASALVQEGDEPAENCKFLIGEYEGLSEEHADLVRRIQVSNVTTTCDDGKSILDHLMRRDVLVKHRNIARAAAQAASPGNDRYRYMRSEIKMVPTVDVAELHQEADDIEKEIRVVDALIQKANWSNDLLGTE